VRARELGIEIGPLQPGPADAITDVAGVLVGHTTLIEGDGVRTGVTVVLPHDGNPGGDPVFAGCHRVNGNGELTGLEWVRESGMLTSPIGLTNTFSVGVVRDALVATGRTAGLPVVGETWDGALNDIDGQHVRAEHVHAALAAAAAGPVEEGGVGGGTGMICHGFKGGIGTASRVVDPAAGGWTVGVLVQANHGRRERFRVDGLPVGAVLGDDEIPLPRPRPEGPRSAGSPSGAGSPPGAGSPSGAGSIIVLVATDAPLLPGQCDRLALRASFGIARSGGVGEHSSGDLVLAYATGNRGLPVGESGPQGEVEVPVRMLSNAYINPLFDAVVDATEEAILNALLAARTMTGWAATVSALPEEALVGALTRLGRPPG
jgi:D-aminopeptidase